jgi:glycosyltransferase involved in cell wall biosynthesis
MTMQRKRIQLLATGLNRGGAETQVFHLAIGLLARGWEVEVISLISGGSMTEQFRAAGIRLHELGMERGRPDPHAILHLRRIILAFRPDIVHSHMVHANLLARLTRLVCPMPALVTTAHSMIEGGRWIEIAYRLTDCLGDLTTTISRAAATRHVRVGSVPEKRLKVVVNGLPLEQFQPDPQIRAAVRQELGIQDEFVWLAVGRFEAPKDYPNLINAISRLSSQRGLFLIAGDGPLRSEIETLAAERNISHHIRFLGIRKDIPALMAAADGYVMSSAWEGLPMVLLEAAGSGLPIVTTDVGGNCEIVRDGISGFLVPPSDAMALSEALLRMERQSPLARAAMGACGREFVIKNYSLSSVLDEWESIYQSFMKNSAQLAYAQRGAS